MVGWHHRLNVHEFEQTLGDGEGQGSLVYCSPWGRKESDTTERLNRTELKEDRRRDGMTISFIYFTSLSLLLYTLERW